jgi:hypothetical protein
LRRIKLPRYYSKEPDLDTTVSGPCSILRSNAVKFVPDGAQIDVLARWEDNSARISVRDMGITFIFAIPFPP